MTHFITPQEYLEGELASDTRHEYLHGQVYAMVGASRTHARIASALAYALAPGARAHGCQLFIADMKVHLTLSGQQLFYYPDLMLVCDPHDQAAYYTESPCLIIEILSDTTERIDRREKAWSYQQLPSLQAYLLVAQNARRVEVFRRSTGWQHEVVTEGAVQLPCIHHALPLNDIYLDVGL